eukprot:5045867-Amphidinium_carterae.1
MVMSTPRPRHADNKCCKGKAILIRQVLIATVSASDVELDVEDCLWLLQLSGKSAVLSPKVVCNITIIPEVLLEVT